MLRPILVAAALAVALLATAPTVRGQGPRDARSPLGTSSGEADGTASISGVVVSIDLGRPVRRAKVRATGSGHGLPVTTTTDDQGRFAIEHLSAGQVTLTVSKPGYLDSIYGQRRPGSGRPGTPLSLVDGQKIERLSLPIARGAALAGTVTDDGGEPAFGTEVRALRYVWQDGQRALRLIASDRADDRGAYRMGALPPGDYVIMAVPASDNGPVQAAYVDGPGLTGLRGFRSGGPPDRTGDRAETLAADYAPVFYPQSTLSRNAATVALDIGEERAGLDLQLTLVPLGRLTGTVTDPGGQPSSLTSVSLISLDESLPGLRAQSTTTGPGGRFAFTRVAPGRYRVRAHSGPSQTVVVEDSSDGPKVLMRFTAPRRVQNAGPGGQTLPTPPLPADLQNETQQWAEAEVVVSGPNTPELAMVLQPGLTVSGRVRFDGSGQPPSDLTTLRVVLSTVDELNGFSSAMGTLGPDGRFTIPNVIPGQYRPQLLGTNDWHPTSFDVAGQDALDFMLDVPPDRGIADAVMTMTSGFSTLAGTLRGANNQPVDDCTIVVFAEDPRYWTPHSRRIHATRPATDGRFSFGNLPAGAYRLMAVEDMEDGQWFDPAVLQQLSGAAVPLQLGDGEHRTQDLRVAR
jgi:hypothetical protein